MSRILIVDDEASVLFTLTEVLEELGHEVVAASSGEQALSKLEGVDAVITDLSMQGMDGLTLLARVREHDARVPVVLLTARGSERLAVRAMKEGVLDYLTKPFDLEEMRMVIARALELSSLRKKTERFELERAIGRAIVGESVALQRVIRDAERIAGREVPVLISGETGTGKELLANVLHARGRRKDGPFVRFNCAAISAELAEAELFGHTKGAFTGASESRVGFFVAANGGTLVLDEVGELPLSIQPKLLRAVQEGEIQPVGTAQIERVDVRIVACTNRDLRAQIAQGLFREDLYYRLAVVELVMPPLRERTEDIVPLAHAFAARYGERFGVDVVLSDALLDALVARAWPGNVRELENTIARLVALSEGGVIGAAMLERSARVEAPANAGFRERVEAFERDLIVRALDEASGNRAEAARRLGIARVTLVDRIKKLGIS